jgi:hypothetical protein
VQAAFQPDLARTPEPPYADRDTACAELDAK